MGLLYPGQIPPSEYALSMPDLMAKLASKNVQGFNFGGKAYARAPGGDEPYRVTYDRFADASALAPPATSTSAAPSLIGGLLDQSALMGGPLGQGAMPASSAQPTGYAPLNSRLPNYSPVQTAQPSGYNGLHSRLPNDPRFATSAPRIAPTVSSATALGAAMGGNGAPPVLPGQMNRPPFPLTAGSITADPYFGGAATSIMDAITGGTGRDAVSGGAGQDMTYGRLPQDMIRKESGGKQFDKNGRPLTSSAGAIGIAQVMPATGPEAAALAGLPWDEQRFRNDAQYNEALGAAYYNAQLQRYGGDRELARAAYNAGPGRTDQYVSGGRALPSETVKYADMNGDGRIGGVLGQDTMLGGSGSDTMTPAAQPGGGNGMAGQGLFNITPEVTDGLLATYQPTWQDKVGAGLSGLGAALAAAGAGNQNWGLLGGQAIQGAMKGRREEATQARREKAMQGLAQANPQLAALFALGGPESVGRVLAAQMMPGDPQGLMEVRGGVFDKDKRQWVVEPPAPQTEYQFMQDANSNPIAVNKADPTQFQPIGPQATGPKPTDDIREYEYAKRDGFPGTFPEFLQSRRQQTNVNVNTAGETAFSKRAGEKQADNFADLAGQLPQIGQRELQISQLGQLVQQMPQGAGAPTAAWLDSVGRTLGLSSGQIADQAQAMEAIANQIVPTLRMAGSGTMSDRDVELFKSTLPQLSNTPGANQAIMSILSRSVAAQRQISEIANRALAGEISPADANKQIGGIQILTDTERQQLQGMANGENRGGLRSDTGITPQAIGGMSMDALARLNPGTLTEDQRAAAEKRWDELSGGANGGQ